MSELPMSLFRPLRLLPPVHGRREFLACGIAALGLGALAAGRNAAAAGQAPTESTCIITFAAFLARPRLEQGSARQPADGQVVAADVLDDMDQASIATASSRPPRRR